MVTSIYRGGLGNQLFQVAAGYALADLNDDVYHMNVSLHMEKGQGYNIAEYKDNIFSKIPKTDVVYSNLYKEPDFSYNDIPYTPNLKLDGYFQSEKYFITYRKRLTKLFNFEAPSYYNGLCAVQIRTGDYLSNPDFNVITPNYIRNAIDFIKTEHSNVKFMIVTDNKELAKHYFPSSIDHIYSDQFHSEDLNAVGRSINDLHMMSRCDCCIISNSSYGWWGSYLGKEKLTIAPDRWFNKTSMNTKDVYRSDMIKVSV